MLKKMQHNKKGLGREIPRALRVFTLVLVMVILFSGTTNALSVSWFDVRLTVDSDSKLFRTTADTVGKFLTEQGVSLSPLDTVTPSVVAALTPGNVNTITIRRGFNVTVYVDGASEVYPVRTFTTVGQVIAQMESDRNIKYVFLGNAADPLKPNKEIYLSTVHTETVVSNQPIMYETSFVSDDALEIGVEKIQTSGKAGELEIVTNVTYKAGEIIKTQIVSERIVEAPVTEVIKQGTKTPPPRVQTESGMKEYTKVITMNATAYSAHYECTGKNPGDRGYGITASGMPVRHGVVAVDPKIIPIGTKLYVEGYGESIAADTGSAIIGNKIDLYHESYDDAKKYGRRNIQVYVLAQQ